VLLMTVVFDRFDSVERVEQTLVLLSFLLQAECRVSMMASMSQRKMAPRRAATP